MTAVEKAVQLFIEYRESFADDTPEALERQGDFEDEMQAILCELSGRHWLGPDDCNIPAHDYCYMCDRLARDLGLERDPERPGKYRQVTA